MNELHSWFYANSLILNIKKTTEMPFHARQERDIVKPQIKFGNIDIAYTSEAKFLGIHFSEYMKCDAHVRSLSSKLSKFCYMIKFLTDVTSPCFIWSTYFAYLHAHLRYGLVLWSDDSKCKIIFKLQKCIYE
jgi:hypothetical protein